MQKFIQKITRQAGQIILDKFGKVGVKYTKENKADVVTEADLAANDYLIEQISKKYPDHGIISEESEESNAKAEYVWIIDPLDGTRNFSLGTPLFGTMVGLARKGEMIMGVLYDPTHDELVFAEKGKGAYLNDQKIKCSKTKEFENSYGVGFSTIFSESLQVIPDLVNSAAKEPFWMNAFGCACFAAMQLVIGRRDWLVSLHGKIWDVAAPAIIFEEAGLKITDIEGKPWRLNSRGMIAANSHLHPKLEKIITGKE